MRSGAKNYQTQGKAKRDGVINPQYNIFYEFLTRKFGALKRYKSTEVDRRTILHVSSVCQMFSLKYHFREDWVHLFKP